MARDFYTVLAVPRNATEDQIRRRFRELARTRHPDRFRGAEKERAERDFQAITQAFNVLSDAERRRLHDLELLRPEEATAGEAASNFDQATQYDPRNAQAWHHLAQACSQQKNWLPRAVAAIERACDLEPMNPAYLKQAGRILALAGESERAVLFYRKSLQWGDDDPEIRQALEELNRAGTPRRGLFGKAG
jgi:curved DNA-binding protein CbpA